MRIYFFVLLSASTSLSWAFADCSVCPEMVTLKTGSFYMGSSDLVEPISLANPDLLADEKPHHSVNIQSFALGKFEVTQSEWNALMGTDPSLKRVPRILLKIFHGMMRSFTSKSLAKKLVKNTDYRLKPNGSMPPVLGVQPNILGEMLSTK